MPEEIFDYFWFEGFFIGYFTIAAPLVALALLILQKPFRRLTLLRQWLITGAIATITLFCYGLFISEV